MFKVQSKLSKNRFQNVSNQYIFKNQSIIGILPFRVGVAFILEIPIVDTENVFLTEVCVLVIDYCVYREGLWWPEIFFRQSRRCPHRGRASPPSRSAGASTPSAAPAATGSRCRSSPPAVTVANVVNVFHFSILFVALVPYFRRTLQSRQF